MTLLGDLRSELFPAARAFGPAGEAQIAWIRVMKARVPAFDALEPSDLAIVPASALAVVAATTADLGPLVDGFRGAPASGVLLVEGDSLAPAADTRLDELETALVGAGIPGLRLPPADPAAVERSAIGLIVARTAELDRQASLLEADVARRALAGEGVEAILGAAATFLARPLALVGPAGGTLAVHAPSPDGAASSVSSGSIGSGSIGSGSIGSGSIGSGSFGSGPGGPAGRAGLPGTRIALPSGGAIVVLGPEPASDLDRAALGRIAGLVALELSRDEAIQRAVDRRGRAESLPTGGPPWIVVLARQRDPAADDGGTAARADRERLRREVRLLAPARRLALRGDADSLELRIVVGPPDPGLVERIAATAGRTVATSRPFSGPADRPTAEAEARATLEAALALPDPPRVARGDRLSAYRLLGAMHNVPDGRRLAAALLEPILDARPDVRRERLETLRAILELGGVNEAATALGVHRNTIAYRLRRIERQVGWRPTDPDIRLPLAIALQLVHEDQV